MRSLVCALSLLLLPLGSCDVKEKLIAGRPDEIPVEIRNTAMPLIDAIAAGKVTAHALDTASSSEAMAISLVPKDESEIWVRIDPGYQAQPMTPGECSYATYLTYYAHLRRSKPRVVSIPHVQLHFSEERVFPKKCELRPVRDPRILKLFSEVDTMGKPPEWEVLQLATFVLNDDIDRPKINILGLDRNNSGIRGKLNVNMAQVYQALDIIERQGVERSSVAVWSGIQEELEGYVEDYENRMVSKDPKVMDAFRKVSLFYPIQTSADVVEEAFDRHSGEGVDVAIRRLAFEALRRRGNKYEMEVIRRAVAEEASDALRAEMQETLKVYAAPR